MKGVKKKQATEKVYIYPNRTESTCKLCGKIHKFWTYEHKIIYSRDERDFANQKPVLITVKAVKLGRKLIDLPFVMGEYRPTDPRYLLTRYNHRKEFKSLVDFIAIEIIHRIKNADFVIINKFDRQDITDAFKLAYYQVEQNKKGGEGNEEKQKRDNKRF